MLDISKHRSDDERDAIRDGKVKTCEACCFNCGWSYPPENKKDNNNTVWCSHWEVHRAKYRFCVAWTHYSDCPISICPPWCTDKYSKCRKILDLQERNEVMAASMKEVFDAMLCVTQ